MKENRRDGARRAWSQTPREAGAVPFPGGISRLYCFLVGRLDKLQSAAGAVAGQRLFLFGAGGWLSPFPQPRFLIL